MDKIIYTLIVTHITIISVTLFLHRSQAHRGIYFHPIISHFMRFWLWLTTGMNTKAWVAIHRKHHRYCETQDDPHSPHVYGIFKVLFAGAWLYANAANDKQMISSYGVGTPNDWVENKIYTPHPWLGVFIMLLINLLIFGYWGFLIWGIQMIWIPFWAAGVVNGLGHWWGYKNGVTKDKSKNISPFGIIIGGEELHNNHHLEPKNPKLSRRWFEFDLGWVWFNIFKMLGLAKLT
jgi:stearoyl-CoA desaturase (delta-9 desaturase)